MADDTTVDYGEDISAGPADNILAQIDHLANALLDAEDATTAAEAALQKAKDKERDLRERQLPEVLQQARQVELTTASNVKVKLRDVVKASIPEKRQEQGFAWLRANDGSALIKTELSVPFEAGRDPAAVGLHALLIALSTSEILRERLEAILTDELALEVENLQAAFAFLRAISNNAPERIFLEAKVHAQSLAAFVRELLKEGKIDQEGMAQIGAAAWKEVTVKRK